MSRAENLSFVNNYGLKNYFVSFQIITDILKITLTVELDLFLLVLLIQRERNLFRQLLFRVESRKKLSFLSYHLGSLRRRLFSTTKRELLSSFHLLMWFHSFFLHSLLYTPSRLSRCVNHSFIFQHEVLFLLQEWFC